MRRETLVNALRQLSVDVVETGVLQTFRELAEKSPREKEGVYIPLDTFQKYVIVSSKYGAIERRILDILGLGPLLEPTFWQSIQVNPDRQTIFQIIRSLNNLNDLLPRIIEMISQDYVEEIRHKEIGSIPQILVDKEILSALITEDEGVFSSPERLIFCIQSISDLYFVHAQIVGLDGGDLIVLACDSGSDKSFDFLGAAKAIAALKETIIFLWDSTVYYRHGQARATVETIAKTLPVLAHISELESAKSIPPELAEQLRRKTLGACSKFYEAGVIIPEMEREANQSPRALMAPERRLLAGPMTPVVEEAEENGQLANEGQVADTFEGNVDLAAEVRELQRRLDQAEKRVRPARSKRVSPKS